MGGEAQVFYFPAPLPPESVRSVPAPRDPGHAPVVYYMRLGDLVKIGTTKNMAQRTGTINPEGVLAVEFGDVDLERARHNQFAGEHHHGEWYRWAAPLGAHVIEVRAAFEAATGKTTEAWLAEVGAPGMQRGKRRKPSERLASDA